MMASKRRKLLLPIERLLEVGDQIVRIFVQAGDRMLAFCTWLAVRPRMPA